MAKVITLRIVLSLACISLIGCSKIIQFVTGAPKPPRLVVLYATCTVNKNYLSPYNPNVTFTPHIERFSQQSQVFTKHRTEAGLSGIAFASIFTGNQAPQHGIFAQPTTMADSVYDVTEAFADNGYDVFFWNNHNMGASDLNYGQGAPKENVISNETLDPDDERFGAILKRLSEDKEYKAFILTNFTVSHGPYLPDDFEKFGQVYPGESDVLRELTVEEFRKYMWLYYKNNIELRYNFPQAKLDLDLTDEDLSKLVRVVELLYKSRMAVLDHHFGLLLKKIDDLRLADESLIVFTADHGESLYRSHAPFKWSHGHALQADVLDVPLIIRMPAADMPPRRCDVVTRSMDVFPTMAQLSQLQLPANINLNGYDLTGVMKGKEVDPQHLAFSHTGKLVPTMGDPTDRQEIIVKQIARFYPRSDLALTWVAVRQNDMVWKYRNMGGMDFGFQAFDLSTDPGEENDTFDPSDPQHQMMAEELKRYKEILLTAYREWEAIRAQSIELPDEERLERLRSLGYIE